MKRLGMLFLAGVFVLTNSFFVFGQTTDSLVSEEQGNEYNYSIQEIVDEVNQKYGTDIQLDEPLPSERTITDVNTTTLIISKKPGNTGISRDIRTEFTTDLLLSD